MKKILEKKFWKKILAKIFEKNIGKVLEKFLQKIFEKNIGKILEKNFGKKFWKKILEKIFEKTHKVRVTHIESERSM